jgi:translation initiation factor 2 subunit 2
MVDYKELLAKARKELPESVFEKERFVIPKVKGHIQGNKTVINNFLQICDALHREAQHVLKYVSRAIATPGELKKSGSLLVGAKVPASRINQAIQDYAELYVFCPDTGKPDTVLEKEGSLTYLKSMVTGTRKLIKSRF